MPGNLPGMLAGRNGLSPVMVGRASELARLRRLLAARSVPDVRVALISGEAGIGKTRLLKELIAGLDPDPDALVLGGQAGQGMPGRPFQLLREAVASEVRDWEAVPARLADRDDALRMMLYPIAPRLACDRERDREYGQEELLGTAVDLIRELAPTLLVFEDLHWADAQSVALFGRLALTADLDVLLIGTFRPEGVDRRHPMLELIEALRRLVREDLLAEREQDVFHFRHALTREAIAGQLLGRERRRLHEKALAALQEAGSDDWSAIVWHAQGAGRGEELVAAARAGAEAYVCRGASVDALRLAEHGLAEAPDDPALLAWASKAAWLIGLLDVSVEHGERRLEVARQRGDLEDQAAVLIHLARVHWEAHHPDRQWECVWQALEAARRLGPSPLLARAQARVSEAYMLADDATAAIEWADHTIALAERVGPRSVLLAAQVNKGTAMVEPNGPPSRRRREEGLALLERAVAEAEAADFDLTLHRALWNLMVNQVQSWPLERSWQVYRQLRAASERAGHAADNVGLAIRRSEIHVMEGDRHAALTAIAKGRRLTRTRNPSSVFEFLLDPYEAVLRIEGGELPAAEELLGRSREMMLTASQECDRVWFCAICASLAAR